MGLIRSRTCWGQRGGGRCGSPGCAPGLRTALRPRGSLPHLGRLASWGTASLSTHPYPGWEAP
jgi:hypothetical protein